MSFLEGRLKKHIGYASKLGIPYVVFIGEDELSGGLFTIKSLKDGVQKGLARKIL